jgi:2-oxoglutarate dehydrogenase E1 component
MMKSFQSNSYLFGGNAPYVEELYESYLDNRRVRACQLARVLRQPPGRPRLPDGNPQTRDVAHAPIVQSFAERAKANAAAARMRRRRRRGAQAGVRAAAGGGLPVPRRAWADLDPLKRTERPPDTGTRTAYDDLDRGRHGHVCSSGQHLASRRAACDRHRAARCARPTAARSAAEYMYITDPAEKRWIQERHRIESRQARVRRPTSSAASSSG